MEGKTKAQRFGGIAGGAQKDTARAGRGAWPGSFWSPLSPLWSNPILTSSQSRVPPHHPRNALVLLRHKDRVQEGREH